MTKDYILYKRPRLAGQTFKQFMEFVAMCKTGKRIQLHGVDYVAVDRKSWNEMQSKLNNTKITFGEATNPKPHHNER